MRRAAQKALQRGERRPVDRAFPLDDGARARVHVRLRLARPDYPQQRIVVRVVLAHRLFDEAARNVRVAILLHGERLIDGDRRSPRVRARGAEVEARDRLAQHSLVVGQLLEKAYLPAGRGDGRAVVIAHQLVYVVKERPAHADVCGGVESHVVHEEEDGLPALRGRRLDRRLRLAARVGELLPLARRARLDLLEEGDRLRPAVNAHLELLAPETFDELAPLVHDHDGALHQLGLDAQNLVLLGGLRLFSRGRLLCRGGRRSLLRARRRGARGAGEGE